MTNATHSFLSPLRAKLAGVAIFLAFSSGTQANLLTNGDFSQGTTGWNGFYNLTNNPNYPYDDGYYNQPLVNAFVNANGEAQFNGVYDRYNAGDPLAFRYDYLVMPQKPHISQTLFLSAGSYTLSWDDLVSTHGMLITQAFEVLLDNTQIVSQLFWTGSATPSGHKSFIIDIANDGSHTLAFGLNLPGYEASNAYAQWANRISLDNIDLASNAPALVNNTVPEPETLALVGFGLMLIGHARRQSH